jgi:hypothetical protein
MAETKRKFKEELENAVSSQVVDSEYHLKVAQSKDTISDFLGLLDMIECVRTDKDYDWMSNVMLPEFPSIWLTQMGDAAVQMFRTRDFVQIFVLDKEARASAEAEQELINRTLNQSHIEHYQKYMRLRSINSLKGDVVVRCWWEKDTSLKEDGFVRKARVESDDLYGEPTGVEEFLEPTFSEVVNVDRFNYDVLDSRNVFYDDNYTYSLQAKRWVTVRFEKTRPELEEEKETMGYFNLGLLGKPPARTDLSLDSEGDVNEQEPGTRPDDRPYDIIERYGKFWCKIDSTDESGEPDEVSPGLDTNGEPMKDAEYLDTIITFVLSGSAPVLIRFQLIPYIDPWGKRYKPLVRGKCYIHPTKDDSLGDGLYSSELQVAINDVFNMSLDRTKLATIPVLKGNRLALEDNDTIYFEPGHTMELGDPSDLEEFKIDDSKPGAITTIGMLIDSLQKVNQTYPTTMGQVPELASTTATAVAEAGANAGQRGTYRDLTIEYTMLGGYFGLYEIISYMTYQFASEETLIELMGDKVYDFDPTKQYFYKSVTETIEDESSKRNKIMMLKDVLNTVVQIPNPKTFAMANVIIKRIRHLLWLM